jgi:hypothetical protein
MEKNSTGCTKVSLIFLSCSPGCGVVDGGEGLLKGLCLIGLLKILGQIPHDLLITSPGPSIQLLSTYLTACLSVCLLVCLCLYVHTVHICVHILICLLFLPDLYSIHLSTYKYYQSCSGLCEVGVVMPS